MLRPLAEGETSNKQWSSAYWTILFLHCLSSIMFLSSVSNLLLFLVLITGATSSAAVTIYGISEDNSVARKQSLDLQSLDASLTLQFMSADQQRDFLETYKDTCASPSISAVSLWDALANQPSNGYLQIELFKWCALSVGTQKSIFVDSQSPILNQKALKKILLEHDNVAVVDASGRTPIVHGSYIQMTDKTVASQLLQFLLTTDIELLQTHSTLIPNRLYELISASESSKHWYQLTLTCRSDEKPYERRNHLACEKGYCCSIQDVDSTILLSRYFVVPYPTIPDYRQLPPPYNANDDTTDDPERPFVSTITVERLDQDSDTDSPNLYHILEEKECLPIHDDCTKCLREKGGANCHTCGKVCGCYCEHLCHANVPAKRISEQWTVVPPRYSRHPDRLIPKIVHQTYYEILDKEQYPNMSRLVESFKQSGWDYRFYNDNDAEEFLKVHFPPAVLEAYQSIIPGAFKADLFRYCVLLIFGGVYADVDIQLESALDKSIPPDVGFMVPIDEPGRPAKHQMCLWNGLIAAAPGHPFLVKAIETIVNQVRNRFTSVDIDQTFCPDPELSVLHAYDTLFTAGPCLLGASLNRVLGRNGQTSHVPGELHGLWEGEQRPLTLLGTEFVRGIDENHISHRIPGRTVILHQNKWDCGAHRFTFLEQNLIVAATDLPDSNDRENKEEASKQEEEEEEEAQHEHYSKAHAKTGVYGVHNLYTDRESVNEEIRFVLDAALHVKQQTAVA